MKVLLRKILLLTIVICNGSFGQSSNHGQFYYPKIDNIGLDQGFSARSATQMIQDHKGIIWIASNRSGLIRYDGYDFKTFIYMPADSNSLDNNKVTTVFEDSFNRLFVGAGSTLHKLDRSKNIFYKLNLDPDEGNDSQKYIIVDITEDSKGNIWITTENEIIKLIISTIDTNPFTDYKLYRYEYSGINERGRSVKSLLIDGEDIIWAVTKAGFGQCIFKEDEQHNKHSFELKFSEATDSEIKKIIKGKSFNAEIKAGSKWVQFNDALVKINQTGTKLFRFSPNSVVPYPPTSFENLYSKLIFLKYPFDNGYVFDTELEQFYKLPSDEYEGKSYVDYRLSSTLKTEDGVIFIGTFWGGLYKYNPYKQFENLNPAIKQLYKNEKNTLRFVQETKDGNLLYATRSLFKVNRATGELIRKYPLNFPRNINYVLEDEDGIYWIAYEENGLIKYDTKTNSAKQILPQNFINGINPDGYKITIASIYRDENGILWCGATYKDQKSPEVTTKLLKINPFTESIESFELFNWTNTFLESEFYFVYHILEDNHNKLWLAAGNGVVLFDKETGQIIYYNKNKSDGLLTDKIKTVYLDPVNPDKYLWFGTSDAGIARFDRERESFKPSFLDDGLPSNNVSSIISDDQNNLWLATENGLSKVQLDSNSNPVNFTNFSVFGSKEGNDFTYYYGENAQKTSTGELIFSAPRGIVIFDPAKIKPNKTEPNIYVSDVKVNHKSIPFADNLNLSYDQNTISFLLSVIDFNDAQNNKYAYILEGYDEDWIDNDKDRTAQYTKLPFGNYVFKAKGANSFGVWSDDFAVINISIAPPWYRSNWAYLSYAVVLITIMLLIIKSERHRRKLRFNYEVEKIEKEKLAEVDKFKSNLFTNVSHEFRTPLTLINGPIDSLINGEYGSINDKAKNILSMTLRSGKRLQNLIDQILDLSRLESGKIIVNEMSIDIHTLVNKLEANFAATAATKKIKWIVEDKITSQNEFLLDEDKFEKIMYNLINNAFKFTPENGTVKLVAEEDKDNLFFKVVDTGIGIPEDELGKVFDRFFQSSKNTISKSTGSGIGLAFAKELAEVLGGNISVESELEKGSTFTLTLPKKVSEHSLVDTNEDNASAAIETENDFAIENAELKNEHTILLVEDDTDLLIYVSGLLSNRFKTLTASDGVSALELLKNTKEKVDLIVSDVMMPRMDGFTLLEKLKSDEELKKIPVVMLTAKATLESKLKALRIGVHDYIFKPFSSQEFLVRVTNLLHNFEMRFEESEIVESDQKDIPAYELEWLEKLEELCLAHISDKMLSVSFIASEMAVSESTLKRKLKTLTGMSPKDYIRETKLQFARKLIEQENLNSLSQISLKIGFGRTDYFKKLYIERFGNLPEINP